MQILLEKIELAPFDSPKEWKKQIQRSSGSKDKRISAKKHYLANIDGDYIIGQFSEQWYGWNFSWPVSAMVGVQLDMIEELYEIEWVK